MGVGGGGAPHIKYSKNKVCSSSHAQALTFLFLSLFLALCVLLFRGGIHQLLVWAPLSEEFSCGIHPHHAKPGLACFSFFPSLLLFPSLPPSRTARNWEIKGIEQRPHERHHLGGCVKFPREAFPVRVAQTAETGPARPRGREEELEEN